jgi:zinc and cadmium transporter
MSGYAWLAIYCLSILLASCLGGYIPFLGRIGHSRLQLYLSLSAGIMLGASFFHVMPEAIKMSGPYFGWWMTLGVVGLFCIERFIAPHSHEVNGHGHHDHATHSEHKSLKEAEVLGHGHEHAGHSHHDHGHGAGDHDHKAAAPAVAGWMAVLGLTIHTFMNGVGLAGAVNVDMEKHAGDPGGMAQALLSWPGWAMFLAIVAHKPADALAISTVLSRKGVTRGKILLVQIGFAATVSIGVLAFLRLGRDLPEDLENQLTGAALAFSAGTFLFIALSDLLPEVQFHRHDRVPLFLSLVSGVVLMGLIALLEGDEHADAGDKHNPGAVHPEGEAPHTVHHSQAAGTKD